MIKIAFYGPEIDPRNLERLVGTLEKSKFLGNTLIINAALELVRVDGRVFHNAVSASGGVTPVAVWEMDFASVRIYEDKKEVFEKGRFRAKNVGQEKEFQMYVIKPELRDKIDYDVETLWAVINGMKQATHMPEDYLTKQIPWFIDHFVRSALDSAIYVPRTMGAANSAYGELSIRLPASKMSELDVAENNAVEVQHNGIGIRCKVKRLRKQVLNLFGDVAVLGDGVMRAFNLYPTQVREPNMSYGGVVIRKI